MADNKTNYFLRLTAEYLADPGFDGGDTVSGIYISVYCRRRPA